jgi:hypothetical protein
MVTFVPSRLRCSFAEMKPGAWRTEVSVAREQLHELLLSGGVDGEHVDENDRHIVHAV